MDTSWRSAWLDRGFRRDGARHTTGLTQKHERANGPDDADAAIGEAVMRLTLIERIALVLLLPLVAIFVRVTQGVWPRNPDKTMQTPLMQRPQQALPVPSCVDDKEDVAEYCMKVQGLVDAALNE